jgi:hypothetical protein
MKGGKYENPLESVWSRYVPLTQKQINQVAFVQKGQRIKSIQGWSYPDGYRDKLVTLNSLCSKNRGNPGSK